MASQKRLTIIYWCITAPFLALMASSSYMYFFVRSPEMVEGMKLLGYPEYLLYILGTAKFLGVLAIVYNKCRTLKEWAYAGFTINLFGAAASHAFVGDPVMKTIAPILFWGLLMTSYYLWKCKLQPASSKTC